MQTQKVTGKVLVGVQSVFYAMTLLERLAENIEEGISNIEFLESKTSLSCDAFYVHIDALIILLLCYLDVEEDRELARYLLDQHGIEFDGGSVIDASVAAQRKSEADEELIMVSKSKLFSAFALVILYGHPNVSNINGPDPVVSFEEMRTLFGRSAVKPCISGLMQMMTKKRSGAYVRYKTEHFEISPDVWH